MSDPLPSGARAGDRLAEGQGKACKAAECLIDVLAEAGVPHIFGVVGGAVVPIVRATGGRRAQIVVARHEAGAALMADGYARASGGLGACVANSGPGTTNLIAGVACAYADSIPMVVLTGQAATKPCGKGTLPESGGEGVNSVDLLKGMTRYSAVVSRADLLLGMWQTALRAATGGRPGPVHLCLPADVQEQTVQVEGWTRPTLHRTKTHDREAIKQAAGRLLRARQPAILAGHGAVRSGAAEQIRGIAEMLDIPVATTAKGKGVFPEDHRLSLGPFGYSGSPLAQWYLLEGGADVLLAVGTSLSEWGTMGWDRRLQPSEALLHVDVDPYEIGRTYRATVPLVGDAKSVLTELSYEIRRLRGNIRPVAGREGRFEPPPERIRFRDAAAMESAAVPIKPQRLIRDLQDALPRDTLVFVDGGANRAWAIHYWQAFYPRTFFCATAKAATGYGVAAAIGGKFAAPDRVVVSIAGAGGFLKNGMEVSTAVRYHKQVIWIVLNPAGPGAAHHTLRTINLPALGAPYARVDCARVAEALGAQGISLREPGQINRELLGRIVEGGRPTVLDVETDPNEAEAFQGPLEGLGNVFDG